MKEGTTEEEQAMNSTRTPGQQMQDDILKTVQTSQEAVLDAVKAWADAVQSITPQLPAVNPPFADKLPKPEEVVANAYDFAEQLLASRTFKVGCTTDDLCARQGWTSSPCRAR
jgi:hypothetical protein